MMQIQGIDIEREKLTDGNRIGTCEMIKQYINL